MISIDQVLLVGDLLFLSSSEVAGKNAPCVLPFYIKVIDEGVTNISLETHTIPQ